MTCGCGGSKSRLAKEAGAEPSGEMRDEKLHAVVARSTFASEKLWREAHLQVKKLKTSHVRRLLEVEMSKKCTLLWREAHFQVKMYKTHQLWNTFWSWHVGKVRAVLARSTFRSQNVQSTSVSDRFRVGWKAGGDQGAVRKPSEEAVVTCPSISGFGVNSPGLKPSSSCCGQVRLDLSLAPRNKVPAGRPGILLHLPNWM